MQRLRINGKYIDIGLDGYPATLLAQVRKIAVENKNLATEGIHPHAAKSKPVVTPSINRFSKEFPEIRSKELSNEKFEAKSHQP